jgi:mRNA-capping enzyme
MSDKLDYLIEGPKSDGPKSSAGPTCIIIKDKKLLQEITTFVLGLWPNRINDYFPGPLPVSLELRNFSKLKALPYVICVKSDGIRFFLAFFNGVSYMIDRTFKIAEVAIKFKSTCKGLLFDGELIKNNDNIWTYIIHDCVCMNGVNISNDNFDQRYEILQQGLVDYFLKDPPGFDVHLSSTYIKLSVKKFFTFDKINEFKEYIKTIDHPHDGFIMTPVNKPIGTGTQYTLFKWKPKESHTFDFRVKEDHGVYYAYVIQYQKEELFASISNKEPEGKEFENSLKKIGFKSGDIVECRYDDVRGVFEPILIRLDKSHPNNINTVEKTLINIKEAITMDELFNLSPKVRINTS